MPKEPKENSQTAAAADGKTGKKNGILLMTHGNLGKSFYATWRYMAGQEPEGVATLSLSGLEDPAAMATLAKNAVADLKKHYPSVVILTDLYGSTPAKTAHAIANQDPAVVCVFGLNMAMLSEAINAQTLPQDALVKQIITTAKKSITTR